MLYSLGDARVELRGADHFIAPGAAVLGRVVLESEVSVWFGAVIRGDNDPLVIGARSNVQDGAVLHSDAGVPFLIGPGVSVGHQAMLHGCTIGAGSLVGIKAVILNHAVIGRECLIGAGALVTEGKVVPDRSLVMGVPGKVIRTLTDAEVRGLREAADDYVARAKRYLRTLAADARNGRA